MTLSVIALLDFGLGIGAGVALNNQIKHNQPNKQQNIKHLSKSTIKIKSLIPKSYKGSVYVIKNGKALYKKHEKTTYLINSLQKSITAYMLLNELKAKHIKLTTTLHHWYPDLAQNSKVTLKDLFLMQSGYSLDTKDLDSKPFVSEYDTVRNLSDNINYDESYYHHKHYASVNYVLLAGILNKVSDRSYAQNIQYYFKKQASNITFVNQSNFDALHGHVTNKKTMYDYESIDTLFGAGTLMTDDKTLYGVFKQMLENKPKQWNNSIKNGYYGFGLYQFKNHYASNGAGHGYYSAIRISKDGKTCVILQTNYSDNHFNKFKQTADKLFDVVTNTK